MFFGKVVLLEVKTMKNN